MYAGTTGTRNDHAVADGLVALHWGLRDTMVRAYVEALSTGAPNPVAWKPELHRPAYALLRAALLMTMDVLA